MRLAVHEEANDEDQESYASLLGGRSHPPTSIEECALKEVKSRSLRLYGFWMSVHQATTKSAKRVP